jgi:NitT/TauT family transport system ATP-binding protein
LVASSEISRQQAPIAIELDGVQKVFSNGVRALDPVSLSIREGEFVSLIGPSGCGKSTLLRMIAGLDAPSAGTVRLSREVRQAAIGFVFQSPTLMPWSDVLSNTRLPLDLLHTPRAEADERVHRALDLVGLGEFAHFHPRELSGGMQMRVSIARALVSSPRLLLMDEPFGALDEITRNRLDRDLSALCERERLTVLFVTHSIYEASFLSSRVLAMSARPGRIFSDVAVNDPRPRTEAFRSSESFILLAARLSATLATAMHEAA